MDVSSVTQTKVLLPQWNVEITLVRTPKGPYYLMKELCAVLGIVDVKQQRQGLSAKRATSPYVEQWPVKASNGGTYQTWCIHRRILGFWFGGIDEARCRPGVQDRIVEFQMELIDLADRALFGEVASEPARAHLVNLESQLADHRRYTQLLEARIGHLEGIVLSDEE
jgi:hypothetical protein